MRELQKFKLPIFLDLKLHDIPNTVKRSVESIIDLRPEYLSVHISGGENMLKIIERNNYTKIIGITLLTSLDEKDLVKQGIYNQAKEQVIQLVKIAKKARLDGVVSSPSEIPLIRKISSENFIIISPGIRLKRDSNDDQKRVMTPKEAINLGADFLVIGRPITGAENIGETLDEIYQNIS